MGNISKQISSKNNENPLGLWSIKTKFIFLDIYIEKIECKSEVQRTQIVDRVYNHVLTQSFIISTRLNLRKFEADYSIVGDGLYQARKNDWSISFLDYIVPHIDFPGRYLNINVKDIDTIVPANTLRPINTTVYGKFDLDKEIKGIKKAITSLESQKYLIGVKS